MLTAQDILAGTMGGALIDDMTHSDTDLHLEFIDTDNIQKHPENRAVDEKYVWELAESIKNEGLGQAPLVRLNPDSESSCEYEHIAGWHRILAYRLLLEQTKDSVWEKIPCIVQEDISDENARMLMWATNVNNKSLTKEEEATWYRLLATQVSRERLEHPGKWRGVSTNQAIAEKSKELTGADVSASTVARRIRSHTESKSPLSPSEMTSDELREEDFDVLEARRLLDSIGQAIDDLTRCPGLSSLPADSIRYHAKRLKALAK